MTAGLAVGLDLAQATAADATPAATPPGTVGMTAMAADARLTAAAAAPPAEVAIDTSAAMTGTAIDAVWIASTAVIAAVVTATIVGVMIAETEALRGVAVTTGVTEASTDAAEIATSAEMTTCAVRTGAMESATKAAALPAVAPAPPPTAVAPLAKKTAGDLPRATQASTRISALLMIRGTTTRAPTGKTVPRLTSAKSKMARVTTPNARIDRPGTMLRKSTSPETELARDGPGARSLRRAD